MAEDANQDLKLIRENELLQLLKISHATVEIRGLLHAKVLRSPHAHARIVAIDDSQARAMPGVHAVLHCGNTPRVKYASGGQSWPNPYPWNQVSFDDRVGMSATGWRRRRPIPRRSPRRPATGSG